MRVLVTGHHGYIGAVVIPRLQAAGHEVVGLDTGYFADCGIRASRPLGLTRAMDIRDLGKAPLRPQDGIDAVIHLAALSNDPLGAQNPQTTHERAKAAPAQSSLM